MEMIIKNEIRNVHDNDIMLSFMGAIKKHSAAYDSVLKKVIEHIEDHQFSKLLEDTVIVNKPRKENQNHLEEIPEVEEEQYLNEYTESVKKPLMYNRSFKEIKNDHYNVPHYNVPHGSSSSKHPDMDQGGHGEFEDWYPVDFNKN